MHKCINCWVFSLFERRNEFPGNHYLPQWHWKMEKHKTKMKYFASLEEECFLCYRFWLMSFPAKSKKIAINNSACAWWYNRFSSILRYFNNPHSVRNVTSQSYTPDNCLNYDENWISYVPHLMKHYRYRLLLVLPSASFELVQCAEHGASGWIEFPPICWKPSLTYNVIKCGIRK